MADAGKLTALEFESAEGTQDWRADDDGASAQFVTGSFSRGANFVSRIAELADAANHHPDVDVRYGEVTVRLFSHDVSALTQRDVDLALAISSLAVEMGLGVRPADAAGGSDGDS